MLKFQKKNLRNQNIQKNMYTLIIFMFVYYFGFLKLKDFKKKAPKNVEWNSLQRHSISIESLDEKQIKVFKKNNSYNKILPCSIFNRHCFWGNVEVNNYWNKYSSTLPVCYNLSSLNYILLPDGIQVHKFHEFSLGKVLKYGQDHSEIKINEQEFNQIQTILWHKITYENDSCIKHECMSNLSMAPFVQMTEESLLKYCNNKHEFSTDFEPQKNCQGVQKSIADRPLTYPYCIRETSPVAVMSIDCLILESGFAHVDVSWNMMVLHNGGNVIQYFGPPGRFAIPTDVSVREYDEVACAGTSQYPHAPGHFYNEILPNLLHLDEVVPEHIPILWPDGDIPNKILKEFQLQNFISKNRIFIQTGSPSLIRIRRAYVHTSDMDSKHTPIQTYFSQSRMHHRLLMHIQAKNIHIHNGIVVLSRGTSGTRSLRNQDELVEALKKTFPHLFLDVFIPDSNFLTVLQRIYPANIIIGPHGANLNNIFGARPSSLMIEIGYVGGMIMPSEYFCLSRNLGLKYWLSVSASGNYGSEMTVNVDDIIQIIKNH